MNFWFSCNVLCCCDTGDLLQWLPAVLETGVWYDFVQEECVGNGQVEYWHRISANRTLFGPAILLVTPVPVHDECAHMVKMRIAIRLCCQDMVLSCSEHCKYVALAVTQGQMLGLQKAHTVSKSDGRQGHVCIRNRRPSPLSLVLA